MTITPAPQADLLQTKEGCIQAAITATDNYRECMLMVVEAWVKGRYGPLEELAEAIGRKPRTLKEYQTELRKQNRLPQHYNSRPGPRKGAQRTSAASVENVVIDVEPTPSPKKEEKPNVELVTPDSFFNPQTIATPENNVRRHQPERPGHATDNAGSVLPEGFDPDSNDSIRQLADQLDQESGEPESYLRAARMLREISRLLEYAKQDGWSQAAFGALRDDAESIASSCRAGSGNSRERDHQQAEAAWANKLRPAVRSGGTRGLLGGTSSELDTGSMGGGSGDQST